MIETISTLGRSPVAAVDSALAERTSPAAIADTLERLSRWCTYLAFAIAMAAAVVTPLLAVEWSGRPYPGFMIDPTLVINSNASSAPSGATAALRFPRRVVRISGEATQTVSDFDRALLARRVGDTITIFVADPGGEQQLVHPVRLTGFPRGELLRLFWLPYLVGLAYLAIGLWVYSVQGHTRPGRALAFFCACTAVVTLLLFDATSTHVAPEIWSLAMALEGGTLLSLAMRFPTEWRPIASRPWILAGPYLLSLALALWSAIALNSADRWAYVTAWGASYRYAAVGIVVFILVSLYRARRSRSALVRRQARIVLLGSTLAFVPVTIWFLAPLAGVSMRFETALLLPPLLIFPLSAAVAIVRYRLWEVDSLVNQTVVYGTLTAILAGLYTASISLSQRLFVAVTGERSDAAIVITTLIVASAFTPVRVRLQAAVERAFQDPIQRLKPLKDFGNTVRSFVELSDADRIARRLLETAATSLRAESAALRLARGDGLEIAHTFGAWRGHAAASIPIEHDGRRIGLLQLGPRKGGERYRGREIDAAAEEIARVAPALQRG